MRGKLAATAGTLAIGAAALGAGGVLAGGVEDGPGQGSGPVEIRSVEAKPVAGPTGTTPGVAARTAAKKKRKRPQVIYLETEPQTLPTAGKTGFVIGNCRRRAKALNGYYFIEGQFNGFGLENEGDSPSGVRRWAFYLENETTAPISGVTFGLVCLKNVR